MAQDISYFAAGPAKIPDAVLKTIQQELVEYQDTKVSVMELSHRSKDFGAIVSEAEKLVRDILEVPTEYEVLFLQGGGTGQFAAVPLNLINRTGTPKADYIVTGTWSKKAAAEAGKYGQVNILTPKLDKFTMVPENIAGHDPEAAYLYYCDNETVEGVEFPEVPSAPPGVPLVCDMSSNFFSRRVDVSKFGVIFGGAQKNVGCAGVTIVIVRRDLLNNQLNYCPSVLNYSIMAKNTSLYNTPPTFAIYVLREVLRWVRNEGGLKEMERRAAEKSRMLYGAIEESGGFYVNPVAVNSRSRMNVVFRVGGKDGNAELEEKFLKESAAKGLLALKGHRSVGGMRASIYNALSIEDVTRLVAFVKEFLAANKK